MIRLLSASPCRSLVVTVMMLSWLVLSNHCALGLMSASPAIEHAGCCGSSAPGQDGGPSTSPVRECCQSMQAVAPAIPWAATPLQFQTIPELWPMAVSPARPAMGQLVIVIVLETGPPEARSFAELVLRHGLRTHAPPYLV